MPLFANHSNTWQQPAFAQCPCGNSEQAEKFRARSTEMRKDFKILENASYIAMLLMFKGQRSRISAQNDATSNELDAATVWAGDGGSA